MSTHTNQNNTNTDEKQAQAPRHAAVGTLKKAKDFFLGGLVTDKIFVQKEEQQIIAPHQTGNTLIPYYLYCHAIELALKAFLMVKGFSDEELKDIGHKIELAFNTAKERGLSKVVTFSSDEETIISWIGNYYKAKVFEYLITGYYELPELSAVYSLGKKLTTELKPYIDTVVTQAIRDSKT